jgi:hypothetical protein
MTRPDKRWWLLQVGTGVVLASILGFFFFAYVPTRTAQVSARNFRLLADMAAQVQEAMANLQESTRSAVQGALPEGTNALSDPAAGGKIYQEKLARLLGLIEPQIRLLTQPDAPELLRKATESRLRIHRTLRGADLLLSYNEAGQTSEVLTAVVDAFQFFRPLLRLHDFDDVLIVRDTGEVDFQLSQTESRLSNTAGSGDLLFTQLPEYLRTNDADDTSMVSRATSRIFKQLDGVNFRLFSQPMQFSSARAAGERAETWFLCGLVRAENFRAQTWAVSPTPAILLLSTVMALLLLWPFLNFWFCGPLDDLKPFEIVSVIAAGFIGCALLTLLFLHFRTVGATEDETHGKLRILADRIESNVRSEFGAVGAQLKSLDENLGPFLGTNFQVNQRTNLPAAERTFYPHFSMSSWVASSGTQTFKWTPRATTTRLVPVADREYFRSHMQDRAWPGGSGPASRLPERFYVESIFSKNRNLNTAIFSTLFRSFSDGPPVEMTNFPPAVSTIELRPQSLFHTILPPDYGFCVMDRSGKVLFHSDERRNLRENFLNETDRDERVRACLLSRTANSFDTRYGNKMHHIRLQPFREFPEWTLAVFRDDRPLVYLQRTTLVAASILLVFAMAALLLVGGLAVWAYILTCSFQGKAVRFRSWLWPTSARKRREGKNWLERFVSLPASWRAGSARGLWFFVPALLAFLCYWYALRVESQLYLKAAMIHIAQELEERRADFMARFTRTMTGSSFSDVEQQVRDFHEAQWSRYFEVFSLSPGLGTGRPAEPSRLGRFYALFRPVLDRPETPWSGFLPAEAWDRSWAFELEGARLALRYKEKTEAGGLAFAYPLPAFGFPQVWAQLLRPLIYSLAVIAFFIPFLLGAFLARRIFLLDLPREFQSSKSLEPDFMLGKVSGSAPPPSSRPGTFEYAENDRVRFVPRTDSGEADLSKLRKLPDGLILVANEHDPISRVKELLNREDSRSVLVVVNADAPDTPAVREQIALELKGKFEERWLDECTDAEKLVLYEIARNGFVHDSRPEIRTLLQRGWVRFAPDLSCTHEAFRRFILRTFDRAALDLPRQTERIFSWRALRIPIAIIIVAVAVLVFATQREIWHLGIGLSTALLMGLNEFSRLRDAVGKLRGSSAE